MGTRLQRSLKKTDDVRIDAGIDARLRLLAVGQLDRKSRDQMFIELAKNPALIGRLAEYLRAPSAL